MEVKKKLEIKIRPEEVKAAMIAYVQKELAEDGELYEEISVVTNLQSVTLTATKVEDL